MIAAFAIRTAVARILRGATLAGMRVHEAALAPVDQLDQGAPFIVVNTEDQAAKEIDGCDLGGGERVIDLVIEIGSGHLGEVELPNGGTGPMVFIEATDTSKEAVIDLIVAQITAALAAPQGPWGDVLSAYRAGVEKIEIKRGIANEGGERFAFRQIVHRCEVVGEPIGAVEPGTPAALFLAAMRGDADLAPAADLVEATIAGMAPPEGYDWRAFGIGDGTAHVIGMGPLIAPSDRNPGELPEVLVEATPERDP